MYDLFDEACDAGRAPQRAAELLAQLLGDGTRITLHDLNAAMTAAYGGTDADGRWTRRESFEVLEHATVLRLRARPFPLATPADVAALTAFAASLPTQTARSEEQIDAQQFSTPVDLAALAVVLAQARVDDVVLEPSAGNGLLVAGLPAVAGLQLNELDPARRARLVSAFPEATVTAHDGATINATLGTAPRPSLVLINPPFSRSIGLGADDYAAVRHLQAALHRLQPGGRAVAIMPDWFGPGARMREQFDATLANMTVRTMLRLENAFAKHGTSVSVRLLVIDKAPGISLPATVARTTIADLLNVVPVHTRLALPAEVATAKRTTSVGLFRAVKSAKAPPPRTHFAPRRNEVLPVVYEALPTPAPLAEQVGVYLPYRPSRLVFESAGEHPTPLVESVAMGSVPAPLPQHVPHLPERVVSDRLLSAAQLETVVYAGDAWSQFLPGRFKPDPRSVGLLQDPDGTQYRRGYFVGDGTGAGKGRQIAATILDNWLAGRRRAIWISMNGPLLEDARRDWTALGGLSADVQPLSDWKIDEPITLDQGILFIAYPTLRSVRGDHSRLMQLIAWARENFDGVVAFDEGHAMGGVAGGEGALGHKEGSQQGIAGVQLQNHLPAARVLYASATGASDINNLAYAVRLPLWGPGTAFDTREQFISQIRQGGIAAMELVARDLKAMGLYTARALSFAGVEYEVLVHELTPDQIALYDTYADAWAIIHQNMEAALAWTGVVDPVEGETRNSGAKAAARSRFESTKQRFFCQLLLSMKLPSIFPAADAHLADGMSVVVQLVTTAESILDRRLGELSPDERADLEIDLSPREYVIDYLSRAFPTRQMRSFTDDTGKVRSAPMVDARGNPVYNPEAEATRQELLEHICALPPIMSALDAFLERFGHEAVAEVTGRTKRLVTTADGKQKLETRSTRTAQAEAAAFMNGNKRLLVFSDAGGTGRSYHASLEVKNQQRRVHFLVEPGWRADRAIQGLGRTHRTYQASTPLFRPVTTNCRGELRFTSTIARRLDSLGALTRGQRQTGGQNLFDPADNLESEYAKAALVTWFHLLAKGKLQSTSIGDFQQLTGLELMESDGVLKEELPPIQRWLNRILALRIGMQNRIFEEFLALVETRVSAARDAGRLDIGVETILVERARVIEDKLLRTDKLSGATTHLLTMEIERKRIPIPLGRVLDIASLDGSAAFLVNAKSGRVALQTAARSHMDAEGMPIPRMELMRPIRCEYHVAAELAESSWEPTDRETFARLWAEEATRAAEKVDVETFRLATGLLLPIWSALPADHLAVNRVVDNTGQSWLGRLVPDAHVVKLYSKLGLATADDMPIPEIVAAVLSGQPVELERPFPMTVKRTFVNGQNRIEVVGFPPDQLKRLKAAGCWSEILSYRTRVFAPIARDAAEATFNRLFEAS